MLEACMYLMFYGAFEFGSMDLLHWYLPVYLVCGVVRELVGCC